MAGLIAFAGQALALTDAQKCESAKLKRAGQYSFCRLKADSKAVNTGDPVDYGKCNSKFATKWADAESIPMCPTTGDLATMQARITTDSDDVGACLNGSCPPVCGNGVIEVSEDCDQGNLGAETCVTQGFVGGTLACGAGCSFDTSNCSATRFVDNGDGTVTDMQTGLMWEKKDDGGGLHDKDNIYAWPDAMSEFISAVNGYSTDGTAQTGLGAHSDWRTPTNAELQGILLAPNPCGTSPCVDTAFGPTTADFHWSSTTSSLTTFAWFVDFNTGLVGSVPKPALLWVRAVRSAL